MPSAVLASAPPLPLDLAGPALPGGAPDDPFVLAGARIVLAGVEGGGVREVRAPGVLIAADLRARIDHGPALPPATVRITPIGIERAHRARGLLLIERIAVAHERPVAFLEWALVGADDDAVVLVVDWRLALRAIAASGMRAAHPTVHARANVAIARATGEPFVACFVLSRAPDAWVFADAEGEGARGGFRVRLERGASVRLAITAADDDAALRATLDALADPAALLRPRAARLRALRHDHISIAAPDERVGSAVEWAKVRLDAHVSSATATGRWHTCACPAVATDAALAGIAALAAGNFRAAGNVIDLLRDRDSASDGRATASFLLLCASHLAWTGDIPFLRARWPSFLAGLRFLQSASPPDADETSLTGVLHELAIAAEAIGERATAAATRVGAVIAGARPTATGPAADLTPVLRRLGAAGAALAEGRADEGFRLWREEVDRGFLLAKGAWPPGPNDGATSGDGCLDHPASAARVIGVLVYGILGVEADATRHRLRLRPRLPATWDRLAVTNLALGDAAVDLDYARDGDRHVFTLEQTRGAVPIRAILEATLPARDLLQAAVDGAPARLDPRPAGDRVLVPVQFTLDTRRTLTLRASA